MFTGPVGPVEVFFYRPETVFGNFYWPGAIGSPLVSSPGALNCQIFCEIFVCHIFQRRPQYTQITTIDMYLPIEVRLHILLKCHGSYIGVKKIFASSCFGQK